MGCIACPVPIDCTNLLKIPKFKAEKPQTVEKCKNRPIIVHCAVIRKNGGNGYMQEEWGFG
jgi:hypothetical protein